MILSFTLSMPNIGSWNGQWTGENDFHAHVVHFGCSRVAVQKAQKILDGKYYHYDFGDGWAAGITVRKVNSVGARKIRKASVGFCGYEWMIESIKKHGEIRSEDIEA